MAVQFDFMDSSAKMYTGQMLENSILQQLFGGTPLGPLMPLITPHLNNMLGLEGPGYRSALMDTVLFSNMSPYGTYRGQLNERYNRVANDMLARQNNKARQSWLEGVGRTMMSFRSWQDLKAGGAGTQEEYDAYIRNEAAGRANNFFWQMGYRALDPEGLGAAATYLSQAGANQIRFGEMTNSRIAMARARAVGNMFINPVTNEFEYNRAAYGGMTLGETAQITAELTKNEDFFKGAESIKQATDRLRNKVKEFTNALSPLKDVFGSDIPGMIRAIEDLSGQRMSNMDPTTIRAMTSTVMANATAGGYTIGQLTNMRSQIGNAIYQMNVPFMNDLTALPQAMTVLNMTATGMTPANMSLERYRQGAANFVQRTSNSSGAQYLNAAAALWMDRNRGKTFDDFMAVYREQRASGMGATAAMLNLSGAGNLYILEDEARGSANYAEAFRRDIGGTLAREERVDDLLQYALLRSRNRSAFKAAMDIVKTNPEVIADPSKISKYAKDPAVARAIRKIAAGAGLEGGMGAELTSALVAMGENAAKQPMINRQMAMRDAMDQAGIAIPDSFGTFFNDFLHGRASLRDLITNNVKLAMVGDAGVRKTIGTAIKMAGYVTRDRGLDGEKAAEFANDFATYIFNNGSASEQMMNIIEEYEKAEKNKDKNGMEAAANKAMLVRDLDSERLDQYLTNNEKDGWNQLLGRYRDLDKLSSEDRIAELDDFMTADALDKLLGSSKSAKLVEFSKSFRTAAVGTDDKAAVGYFSEKQALELADKFAKNKGLTENQKEELDNAIKQAYGRDVSSDTQITDLLGAISELIGKMDSLTGDINKLLPQNKNAPAEGDK